MDTWLRDRIFMSVSLGVRGTIPKLFSTFGITLKFKNFTETGQNKILEKKLGFFYVMICIGR